ncbi:MAG TPA: aldehyde dehydrogenase family protein [Thermoplasmata archaeon]|nr:aldehyde dehydrogenase family protein [Thermoplasmata archaeon]
MASASEPAYDLIIGGHEVPSANGTRRPVRDPATNASFAQVAVATRDDAGAAMEAADRAFRESNWAADDGARRARALQKLASLVEAQSEALARLETRNMGKPLRESRGDLGYIVRTLEYFAGLADKVEGETIPVPGPRFDYTLREPLGVTVHLAPWNYPLLLAVRSVAPALAAGNAVVLKPASLTPLTAIAFARLAKEAGIPDGILNVVAGPGPEVGEALVTDPRCASVTLTGSGEVGRRIAELAARRLVPATLELGGKGPVVVFPDADVERVAKAIGYGIFGNAGQMCWAASRLIVHESLRAALVERVRTIAESLKLGPGTEDGVEMGPLVSPEQAERVLEYVEVARRDGGTVVTGGEKATEERLAAGNFVRPTVLADVPARSRAVQEEIFGPVLSVTGFAETEEAIRAANDTPYGLLAALWTRDLGTAHAVARRLEAGMVVVNEAPLTFPQSPFAGVKGSGLGFEQGRRALEPFTRRKNVLLNLGVPKRKG